jgi:hypothetical protein
MLTDTDFWRVIIAAGLPCAFVAVCLRTGASPFFWAAVCCSWLEAALRQLWASFAVAAVEHYKDGFARTHREVRAQVASAGITDGSTSGDRL